MASKLSKWPYVKKPLIVSLTVGFISIGVSFFFSEGQTSSILASINDATTNFGLSFVAFSVTALALLSLAQNQEYFAKVQRSSFFHSFLDRFFLSTKISIVLLAFSFAVRFLLPLICHYVAIGILGVLLGSLAFLCAWVWKCIDDLIDIFKA